MNAAEEPHQETPSKMKRSNKEEDTVALSSESVVDSPSCRPLKKRKLDIQKDTTSKDESNTSPSKRQLSFNVEKNVTHQQSDPSLDFPEQYKESDIWYSREDYEQFLMDRIHTIERLRDDVMKPQGNMWMDHSKNNNFSGSNTTSEEKKDDSEQPDHCMRGLEPFQNRTTHHDMHSKRKLHKSTIITEQVRQAMLGIQDPERFRFLVAPQSNMALLRAQELAAMDEEEVYPKRAQVKRKRNSRRSSMSAAVSSTNKNVVDQRMDTSLGHNYDRSDSYLSMFNNPAMARSVMSASSLLPSMRNTSRRSSMGHNQSFAMPGVSSATNSNNSTMPNTSLFSSSIRQLQEKNAQRLMQMYGGGNQDGGTGKNSGRNLFRFSLRRDSLLGSMNNRGPNACKMENMQQQPQQQLPSHETLMAMMPMATRFHLRRDSLSHLATK